MSFLDNLERFGRNNLSTGGDVSSLDSYDPTQPVGPQNDFSRDFYAGQGSGNELPESMRVIDPTAQVDNLGSNEPGTGDVLKVGGENAQLVLDAVPNQISASQVFLPAGSVQRILPARPRRSSVVIYNVTQTMGANLYVGATAGEATVYGGFPIVAGSSFTLAANCEVWAVASADITVACMEFMYA